MKKITLNAIVIFTALLVSIPSSIFAQQIGVLGNAIYIGDNDLTPTPTDFTDFQTNLTRTFSIDNIQGGAPSTLTVASITLSNTTDFTISAPLVNNTITKNQTPEPFTITFNNLGAGTFVSTVTIASDASNDGIDNVWIYTIQATGTVPLPEIDIVDSVGAAITDGSGDSPSATNNTVFGTTDSASPVTKVYTIQNNGTATLNIVSTANTNPYFAITAIPAGTVAPAGSTTFSVTFTPLTAGSFTSTITVVNNDVAPEDVYTFSVQGTGILPLTEGPGGVVSNLKLWLKGTDGLGYTDGDDVATWADQARGADATVNTPGIGQEPTYKDNVNDNINFNPVVDFDGDYVTIPLDGDFSYDEPGRNFLEGTSGYYSQDIFTVIIPDVDSDYTFGSMDVFCGDEDIATNNTDATGIGLGKYTVRFTNEVLTYCHGPTASGDGYGVAEVSTTTTYDNVGIINVRNNSGATQQELYYNANNKETIQNDVPDFANVNDSRYWIGRSEGWEASTDARIAEVITYSTRKVDTDLTQERNRIQSYLAIKYGITLGVNGTSQDYVDSDGTVIWDTDTGVPADDVFNYDIAGIGRDDDSDLHQKQSRSVNNALDGATRGQGVLTMGVSTIYDTNTLNPSTDLLDKEFLIWGNDGVDLDDPAVVVDIDMSTGITPAIPGGTFVQFNGIARTWKVVENGGDIPSVEVAILENAVRSATPPNGAYLMFIADTPNFGPTADYRVMSTGTNELGEAVLKTDYDFDGTKYITFGWAPERVYTRSVYFDGAADYIDMEDALNLNPTAFTISAWVKRDPAAVGVASIVSKRPTVFTQGYDLRFLADERIQFIHKNGTTQQLNSTVSIPDDEWHHVAVIYSAGTIFLYIDGVMTNSGARTAPVATTDSFYIGAAAKNTPVQYFMGNIDEVRIWDIDLSVDQLQYIMNQEIKSIGINAGGSYFDSKSVVPTKDPFVASPIPWTQLAGYYPMTTYTYTNTKDESGNGNKGALRGLRTVDKQTAPLPYISGADGDWDSAATWTNGTVQTMPGSKSLVDATKTIDWNIVETNHSIDMDNSNTTYIPVGNNDNRTLLSLFVESNDVTVTGDNGISGDGNGLTISHHLTLDGKIDLDGESQLIQTADSDLTVGATGSLEKDQQGTQDLYTYNYWSSPVGNTLTSGLTTNFEYKLSDNILKNGTTPSSPSNITFVSGYDGAITPTFEIASYWIWKYSNLVSDDYSAWQHVQSSGDLLAGEGFTMKGVDDTFGVVSTTQNYTFDGKPNNGDIELDIDSGNDYLVGNPYASAIDAQAFITLNGPEIDGAGADPLISGTLYFWEHWGGGSHNLAQYEGGYGTYNYSGGSPAAAFGTPDPDVAQIGTGTKTPGRYIPVGQGFFVEGTLDNAKVKFRNSLRVFEKEGGATSVFMKSSGNRVNHRDAQNLDERMKLRIGFNSINTIHRQLLVTVDDRASENVDWGFDGKINETQIDDMYWMIADEQFTVQGINIINEETILPLGIHTDDDGLNNITIDILENVPDELNIYAHDKELHVYHDLRESNYEVYLVAGEYLDRFEITFRNDASLSVDEIDIATSLLVFYENANENIVIQNPKLIDIESAEMFTILGQSIFNYNDIDIENHIEIPARGLSTGSYVIKLKTVNGIISKKVLVK